MQAHLPAKNPDVIVDPPQGGSCIVHNAATRKYFKLGQREASFLAALDGSKTRAELQADNCAGFSAEEVAYLLDQLEQLQLTGQHVPPEAARSLSGRAQDFVTGNAKWRFHLLDPNDLLDRHIGIVHALFSRPALLCYLLILLSPVFVLIADPGVLAGVSILTDSGLSVLDWVGIYVAILAMIAVHELAHAAACKHFGGKVHKIGLMLLYLQPVVYCDISDSYRFSSREQKLAVAAAGIFVQLLVSALVFVAWTVTGGAALLHFSFFNALIALFNFFPFVKLDGYWMLVHVLDEPNLRTKGFSEVDRLVRRAIGAKQPTAAPFKAVLAGFGIGSMVATVLFLVLGGYTIHKYVSLISAELGLACVIALCTVYAVRFAVRARSYVRSLKS
ncbi:site-2 protease family protein [Massilia sp. DD77]|uniref:site-2 protease family protein n=1 Tax=Massilia sp. DD77 TaxID=3109349 RepID=UPI002FFF550B